MSNDEIGVKITGDVSDIMSELSNLVSQLNEITDKVVSLVIDTDASSLAEVEVASEEASNKVADVGTKASDTKEELKEAGKSGKDMGKEISDASTSASQGLDALLSAAAAVGSYLLIDQWANAAGQFEDSWSRMSVAVGGTVDTIGAVKDEWSDATSTMSEATGRGGGVIREFITQMTIAGVDSQDAIISSFEGISGAAYVTGNDINTITYALQRATRTGLLNQRTLTALGLSTQDIMNATGKSIDDVSKEFEAMTPTARASFLAMVYNSKYGTDANNAFKASWQGVSEALNRAKGYLEIMLGELILPILVPAMQTTTNLLKGITGWLNNLDPVSKGFLGTLILLGGGFITLIGTVGALVGLYKALNIAEGLSIIRGIASQAVTDAKILANNALIISQTIYNGLIESGIIAQAKDAIVKAIGIAKNIALAAATTTAAAAQWLLNAAMMANPIGLVVIAVAALVAGLYLLYQNNEQVRTSIDGLWASLQGLGAWIQGGFMDVLSSIAAPFQQIYNEIVGFGEDLYQAGQDWIGNLIKGMEDSIPTIDDVLQTIADYFPHSPAKTGPLSDVTPDSMNSYGVSLGTGLGEGVKSGAETSMNDQQFWDLVWGFASGPVGGLKSALNTGNTIKDNNDAIEKAQKQTQEMANMTVEDAQNAGIALDAWATGYTQLDTNTRLTYDSMANRGMEASRIQQQQLELLKQKAIDAYNEIAQAASDAYSKATSYLSAWGVNVPGAKLPMGLVRANVADAIRKLYKQRDAVWSNPEMSILEQQTQYYLINEQIKNLQNYGYSAGSSFGQGLAEGVADSKGEISAAAGTATNALKAHSPPREGPLQKIDEWGINIGQTFIQSIGQGLQGLNIPNMASNNVSSSNQTNINVSLNGANINSDLDARNVGMMVGDGLASKLVGQASNAGVNVINARR